MVYPGGRRRQKWTTSAIPPLPTSQPLSAIRSTDAIMYYLYDHFKVLTYTVI